MAVTDYTGVLAALQSGQVDVAYLSSFPYALATNRMALHRLAMPWVYAEGSTSITTLFGFAPMTYSVSVGEIWLFFGWTVTPSPVVASVEVIWTGVIPASMYC